MTRREVDAPIVSRVKLKPIPLSPVEQVTQQRVSAIGGSPLISSADASGSTRRSPRFPVRGGCRRPRSWEARRCPGRRTDVGLAREEFALVAGGHPHGGDGPAARGREDDERREERLYFCFPAS